ncbi:MAG: hypothetical protein ACRERE_06520, partial [Candidatus Entotheonellia bacterium]
RQHSVYYWVIPADVSGVWRVNVPAPTGARQYRLRLQQEFQEVRGTISADGRDIPLTNVTLTGDHLRFTTTTGDQVQMAFDGRVKGEAMRGSVDVKGGTIAGRYDWRSQREATSTSNAPPR